MSPSNKDSDFSKKLVFRLLPDWCLRVSLHGTKIIQQKRSGPIFFRQCGSIWAHTHLNYFQLFSWPAVVLITFQTWSTGRVSEGWKERPAGDRCFPHLSFYWVESRIEGESKGYGRITRGKKKYGLRVRYPKILREPTSETELIPPSRFYRGSLTDNWRHAPLGC